MYSIITCFQGKGRAFCAGGDVAAVVRSIHKGTYSFTLSLRYLRSKDDFLRIWHFVLLLDLIPMLPVAFGLHFVPHLFADSAICLILKSDGWKYGADFFRNEFLLNYIIATYTKPQVCFIPS